MRKPTICVCKNKGADQLRGNREAADHRLCFRYTDSTILLSKSKISSLAIFCGCTAQFVSDLFGKLTVDFLMAGLSSWVFLRKLGLPRA